MKILFLSSYYSPTTGASILYRLRDALVVKGHSVDILTIKDPKDTFVDPSVHALPHTRRDTWLHKRGLSSLAAIWRKLWPSIFDVYGYRKSILAAVESLQPDIIHIHWTHGTRPIPMTLVPELSKKWSVCWTFHDQWVLRGREPFDLPPCSWPCVHTCCHLSGSYIARLVDSLNRLFKRKTLPQSNVRVIAPSRWMQTWVQEQKIFPNEKVTYIPNGLSVSLFDRSNEMESKKYFGIAEDRIVLLSLSTPSNAPRKGFDYFVHVARLLQQQEPEVFIRMTFLVLGKGAAAAAAALPGNVVYRETVSDPQEMVKAYSAGRIFLLPSIADNLPSTVMESMSCGTPVVAFDVGGIKDLVVPDTGHLVLSGDTQQMVKCIKEMVSNDDKWQKFSLNGREHIVKHFTDTMSAQLHEDFYKQMKNYAY